MTTKINSDNFDWSKCIICQKHLKGVKTTCPLTCTHGNIGSGYKSLADKIERYKTVGELPSSINVDVLDEGDGIEATCSRHSACWHKRCLNQVLHSTTLQRLTKRKADSDSKSDDDNSEHDVTGTSSRVTRGASGSVCVHFASVCFFCESKGSDLRQVLTQKVDAKVRHCATVLGDSFLLGKLAGGDMIATEAKYHPGCLVALYERASRMQIDKKDDIAACDTFSAQSLALAEVIAFIEDAKCVEQTPSVFKLSELIEIYEAKLQQYGTPQQSKVHATRFKDRLLENCPNLAAVNHGRDVLVTFNEHVGLALNQMRENADAEAVHIMHAAKVLRNAIFSVSQKFNGQFNTDSQTNSVSQTLLSFIGMVLEGPGILQAENNQAALSIAQLIVFNSIGRPRTRTAVNPESQRVPTVRHSVTQETPLPLYIGLMLYSATRKKKLINKCNKLGLSVTYDRCVQLCNKTANSVCAKYRSDDLVCPPVLCENLFTVAAVDNIDHNMSSTTAVGTFHGTAISLMQFPSADKCASGSGFSMSLDGVSDAVSDIVLPRSYSDVSPCIMPVTDPKIPNEQFLLTSVPDCTSEEFAWLSHVYQSVW